LKKLTIGRRNTPPGAWYDHEIKDHPVVIGHQGGIVVVKVVVIDKGMFIFLE
jgi:hypothetical protein